MRDLYAEVTARILAELKAGVLPWRRPWSITPGLNIPCNAAANRQYHGTNIVMLWMAARARQWLTLRFVTFKQALELGGHVRKGEHGTKVYFVKDLKFTDSEVEGDEEPAVRSVRFLREYTVFNVAQCDGLPAHITEPPIVKPRHHDARDPLIEEFLATTGAVIEHGADCAVFQSKLDRIIMPDFGSFNSSSAYYGTLFHELAHWTGHESRLNRDLSKRFDRQSHVAEELVAELAAAFICAEFSIDGDSGLPAYIGAHVELLEGDTKAFFTCASKAQAAVDYLRELALREPAQAAE
jgi:antirestriction protein ArdC